MPQAARTDANQQEIVDALRDAACDVFITSGVGRGFPDLVVGRAGYTYLIEAKTDDGYLTEPQIKFHRNWRGHVAIARTIDEALRAVGLLE